MDIVTKICKAMCKEYGDGCKKCSMGNPEAEYSCSVYDDAQLAAKFLDETISEYEKKLEDKNLEIAQLKQELKASDLRIEELEKENQEMYADTAIAFEFGVNKLLNKANEDTWLDGVNRVCDVDVLFIKAVEIIESFKVGDKICGLN